METIPYKLQIGNWLMLIGKGRYRNYYIAATDYAQQVVRAIQQVPYDQNRQYIIQGTEGFTPREALKVYKKNYKHNKLKIINLSIWLFYLAGKISAQANYGAHIIEALNEYPETFEAEDTWSDLGIPSTTLATFAKER